MQADGQTEAEKERKRERERERERERQADRQTDRQTYSETKTERSARTFTQHTLNADVKKILRSEQQALLIKTRRADAQTIHIRHPTGLL